MRIMMSDKNKNVLNLRFGICGAQARWVCPGTGPGPGPLVKKMEIEDVVSVIRAREGAVRGYGPVAGGLGERGDRLPLPRQCRQDLR